MEKEKKDFLISGVQFDGSMKPCELSIIGKWSHHWRRTVSLFCLNVCIGMFTFTKWISIRVVSVFGVAFHTSNAMKIQR